MRQHRRHGERRIVLGAQGVEEWAQRGLVLSNRRPQQPPAVMIHHPRRIPVSALATDLVDADPPQLGEAVLLRVRVGSPPPRMTIAGSVRRATRSRGTALLWAA